MMRDKKCKRLKATNQKPLSTKTGKAVQSIVYDAFSSIIYILK